MSLLQNTKHMADFLSSINVPYSDRPLSPIEVAKTLSGLLDELGHDQNELVRRLPLSQNSVKSFQRLLRLPSKLHGAIVWGEPKSTDELSFSAAASIAKLKDKDDMLKLVGSMHELGKPASKSEIQGIVGLKNRCPEMGIDECIAQVFNVTRPTVIQHYIFISGVNPLIVKSLAKSAKSANKKLDDFAHLVLSRQFPENSIKGIKLHDEYVHMSLSKEGHDFVSKYPALNNTSNNDIINQLFSNEDFGG